MRLGFSPEKECVWHTQWALGSETCSLSRQLRHHLCNKWRVTIQYTRRAWYWIWPQLPMYFNIIFKKVYNLMCILLIYPLFGNWAFQINYMLYWASKLFRGLRWTVWIISIVTHCFFPLQGIFDLIQSIQHYATIWTSRVLQSRKYHILWIKFCWEMPLKMTAFP